MASMRLLVTDTGKAITFYVDHLGFELVEQWGPAFAIIQRDGLEIWESGPQTSAALPLADGSQPAPGGWNRAVIAVNDLAATLDALEAAGVEVRNRPISGPGGQQALVSDGVGNVVEIFESRG